MNLERNHIKSLARRIRRSDLSAFDEFFRMMYPVYVGFAATYTKDRPAACDVAQEAFIALWKERENIDTDQSLQAFMYRIVKNRCLNYLRDTGRMVLNPDRMKDETDNLQSDENPDQQDENGLGEKFRTWIDSLPERQREAFELSRFEGLDHEEISLVMDISVKTVNNHIVAALQQLRNLYEWHLKEESNR